MKADGFTLLELMVTLAIVVTIASIAVPSFQDQLKKYEMKQTTMAIQALLDLARNISLTHKTFVIACPTNDYKTCSKSNPSGIMVFKDPNQNHKRSDNETLEHFHGIDLKYGQIEFNMSRGSRFVKYYPDTGRPRGHFGNITYCPYHDSDAKFRKRIIMDSVGNARLTYDINGDGVDDIKKGKTLTC